MGKLKALWTAAGWAGLWYIGLNAMAESWNQTSAVILDTVNHTTSEAVNILGGTFSQIWNLAPVSQVFIDELSSLLTYPPSLIDAGIATWVWLAAGWVWKKWSQLAGKITGIQSNHDDTVSKIGIWIAGGLSVLWASASAITLWAGTSGYVLGRKLWEKVLGQKYANLLGIIWGAWWIGLTWGLTPWIVLWAWAVALWAWFVWKSWEWRRAQQSEKRKWKWFRKSHFGF